MKKIKLFFALFAMLALNVGNAWAAEETITFEYDGSDVITKNTYSTTYAFHRWTATSTDGTIIYAGGKTSNANNGSAWGLRYANNRVGEVIGNIEPSYDASASWKTNIPSGAVGAIPGNIKQIKVFFHNATSGTRGCYILVSKNQIYADDLVPNTTPSGATKSSKLTSNDYAATPASQTYETSDGYKYFGVVSANSSFIGVKKIVVTYETSGSTEPVLSSIEISGDLENKTYEEGDELDLTGLTVLANYESGDPKDVTNDVEWSYEPLTAGQTSVTVTATYEDKMATQPIYGLTVNEHIITPDEYCITPNNDFWGTSYNGSDANAATTLSGTQNDISIHHTKSGSNLYVNNTQTRVYTNHAMQISVPSGYVITSIAFTADGNNWAGTHTADVGEMTDSKTWTGANQNVTITFAGTCRITNICVTYIKDVKYALTITEPTEGGTLVVKDGENTLASGAEIYEGTKLTVTATPETGYEDGVVVVKNASDEDVTAAVYEAGTLTMPAYAVTISATFAKKPCTLLNTPVVTATPTYNSATLTWEAVANAAKYSVKVGTADAVETTETSYEVTGLTAETEYTYQVQAIAEADQDTYCDSEVAEGSFTTAAAPVATLTLSDIEGTTTQEGALNGTITLPTTAAECSKTFVGWDADEDCDHAPTYAPGAEYTFTTLEPTLYAVYADGESGEAVAIFSETFDACEGSGGNDDQWSGSIASGTLSLTDWDLIKGSPADGCAKFGTGSAKGSAETPAITLTGNATLTFRSGAWNGSSEKTTLNLSAIGATLSQTSVTLVKGAWTEYTIYITEATGSVKIKFEASVDEHNRFFLDDVVVSQASVTYSNYSTTCAAAPQAEVNPTEVTATAAGGNGTVSVTYENVNTANVVVALFNDNACTEAFTAEWLTVELDGDKNITYTVAENTTFAERTAYIQLTAPEVNGATDPAVVVIPVTQAGKDKVFASLAELVAADLTAGDEVTVTLNNDVIKEFYIYNSNRAGVVFDVQKDGKDIKIFFNNQTTIVDWAVGGKLSGTLTNVKWSTYSSAWQLAPDYNTWAWANLTYTEPKAVSTVVVSGAPTKTTYVDGEAFDPAGLTVTVNYNDATSEVNPTGVTFDVTPATLTKGETSVSVTATYNTVSSAPYEVTGLTVNDIPTKTIAEFIDSEGGRCYLEGIVSNITNTTYGNFDLTDASGKIYVYGCLNGAGESQKFAELGVKNGDKIKVIADEYELYGGTKDEAKNVQYVSHVSAASITISDITMEVEEVATITATVDPVDAVVTYTIKENAANAISLSGNTITALAEGTATITATVAAGATYLGNSVDFTVTVGPKTEKVVILAQYEGQWYALKAAYPTGKTDRLVALPVDYFNGTLYNVADEDKTLIEWQRAVEGSDVTFQNKDKYLTGAAGNTNLTLGNDACAWTYNGVSYTIGTRTILYSQEYDCFRNYANQNIGGAKYSGLVEVTAPVYDTAIEIGSGDNSTVIDENEGQPVNVIVDRAFEAGDEWYTLCVPFNMPASLIGTAYQLSGLVQKGADYVEVNLAPKTTIEAGQPYLIEPSVTVNKFVVENVTIVNTTGESIAKSIEGLSVTMQGVINGTGTTGGLYWVGNSGYLYNDDVTKLGLRTYFNISTPSGIAPRMRVVTGENVETGVEDIITTDAPVKVIENGQLIIIRDGVKYNVQGQKL